MTDVFRFAAVFSTSLFAGAALYINVAEHPARMAGSTRNAISQWAPSYKRATWLQAPLALVGALSALLVWLNGEGGAWLLASILIGAVVPFTLIGIMPTNQRLLSKGLDHSSDEARMLLVRWANLHAGRTVLGLLAAGLDAWLVIRG